MYMEPIKGAYEPKSGADLRQHYARIRQRLYPVPVVVNPVPIVIPGPAVKATRPEFIAAHILLEALTGEEANHSIDEILRAVCSVSGLTKNELLSRRRSRSIVMPRHVAIYLAHCLVRHSYPRIGRMIGGLDHSTVIHAVRSVKSNPDKYQPLLSDVEALLA